MILGSARHHRHEPGRGARARLVEIADERGAESGQSGRLERGVVLAQLPRVLAWLFPRVKGLLRKAGYGEQVATVLALLCTEAPREALELRGKIRYRLNVPRTPS